MSAETREQGMARARAALAGRYVLDELLPAGGETHAFSARDVAGRRVALKVVRTDVPRRFRQRFAEELPRLAAFRHPGVQEILDFGASDHCCYYALEWAQGVPLSALMAWPPRLSIEFSLWLAATLAETLSEVHRQGLVHGGVKPTNIFVSGHGVTLGDFAVVPWTIGATWDDEHEADPATGLLVSDGFYSSPEALYTQDALDGRSDVYSLGLLLYELLTGERAYIAPTERAMFQLKASGETPAASEKRRELPLGVDSIIAKAVKLDRGERYRSAAHLARDIRRLRDRLEHPRPWASVVDRVGRWLSEVPRPTA